MSAIFTIDLRPVTPKINVYDNLNYTALGWDKADVSVIITLTGPLGAIYVNTDYDAPDIEPSISLYLNKTIALPLDPEENYENVLHGNYTLKVDWYNSVLGLYETYLKTYQYIFDPPTIANTTVSGPYSATLTSTDTTEYGSNVYDTIREHRIQYPTQLVPAKADIVSTAAEVEVTTIYTNQWTIIITTYIEYRNSDLLRILWEDVGTFTHCVYGGCIRAMSEVINTMLETYYDAMASSVNNQERYQKRLVIVNTAWHLLSQAYIVGDVDECDYQSYVIQEQVAYTNGGVCEGATSALVVACPTWGVGVINHNLLDNVDLAGTGVTYGHISNQTQDIYGDKTFKSDLTIEGEFFGDIDGGTWT
ncbi:MAG: hypothetical protein PF440_00150 [Thiomicrorhabdus sp.]|jgi:hypothetical protein|nr:hypothetical protein [Thiomicrorhabdus sp.]